MIANSSVANAYKNQQIMTASPEELTLMLYNGAIRFVGESIAALEKNELEKAHHANVRAQDIVREFMNTLNMEYEVSKGYYQLYDYIEFSLIQGNVKNDVKQLTEARNLLQELRDTWVEAIKISRQQKATGS